MTVRVVAGAATDVAAMLAVMTDAFDARFGEAWSGPQLLGALSMPDTWAQLALSDLTPVGFALTRRILTQAELLLIAVAPTARGQGIGKQLLHGVMARAMAAGADELFLEVRDGNSAALSLYAAMNFDEVGRRRQYYTGVQGERFDAITMRRRLATADTTLN